MIHYVHVVRIDPERAAAVGKAFTLFFVGWLAWHFLPDAWTLNAWLDGWLGTVWHVVTLPFVLLAGLLHAIASAVSWVVGAVDSAFRVAATVQAVLLPVWTFLAGCCIGRAGVREGAVLSLGAAGLNALCAVLLGYPMFAGLVMLGSVAVFTATTALSLSFCSWAGWLAATLVAGISAWGMERYGTAFAPVSWPLVPLSWCCLALGAAYVTYRETSGWRRVGAAAPLVLLASMMAVASAGPSAVRAARPALMPGSMPPAQASAAPAVTAPTPMGREVPVNALPAWQPAPVGAPHRTGQGAKPASASQPARPRT